MPWQLNKFKRNSLAVFGMQIGKGYQKSIIFVAIVFQSKSFHVFESDFALIVSVENSCEGGNVSGGGVKLLVHGSIEVHEHFSCCNCLQNTVFVVIVHVEYFPILSQNIPREFQASLSAKEPSILYFGDLVIERSES